MISLLIWNPISQFSVASWLSKFVAQVGQHVYILDMLYAFFCIRLGAKNLGYRELSQAIKQHTGGLSCNPSIVTHHATPGAYQKVTEYLSCRF
jgi:Zn-dependent M16 (insulinase) family peptidase